MAKSCIYFLRSSPYKSQCLEPWLTRSWVQTRNVPACSSPGPVGTRTGRAGPRRHRPSEVSLWGSTARRRWKNRGRWQRWTVERKHQAFWVMKLKFLVSCLWGTMSLSSMRCQVLFSVFFSLWRPWLWIGLNSLQINNYKKMHLWMNYSFNYNITPRPPTPHTGWFDANSADIIRLPAALEGGLVDGFHLQAWWLWGRRGKKKSFSHACPSC